MIVGSEVASATRPPGERGRGGGHQATAQRGDVDRGLGARRARRAPGRDLAERMANHGVRAHARGLELGDDEEPDRGEDRLEDLGSIKELGAFGEAPERDVGRVRGAVEERPTSRRAEREAERAIDVGRSLTR